VALADLAEENFVSYPARQGSFLRDTAMRACSSVGFWPRVAQEARDTYTVVALVAAAVGVALLPESAEEPQFEGVVFRPVTGADVQVPIAVAWRDGDPSPVLADFLAVAAATPAHAGPTRPLAHRYSRFVEEHRGHAGGMMAEPAALPPLADENHVCPGCDMSYATIGIPAALAALEQIPDQARAAVLAVPEPVRRKRPEPGTWCVVEYACHIRDVYATYTIRLHRARTEVRPSLEPMLNDLRARRFRYAGRDLGAVLDELADNVDGFRDEIRRTSDAEWDRVATRLPHEVRSARWLVRQALHEGHHHIRDVIVVGRAAAGA
jgi:hypothetical protein